jgi:hypothetical protein
VTLVVASDWVVSLVSVFFATAQKAAMIHKQITRRPTDDEIEAKQFRAAYKDKTGKKMLSYVDDMIKIMM